MPPTHRQKIVVAPLTEEELDAVTVVFHQFETGLREGTIYTKVWKNISKIYILLNFISGPTACHEVPGSLPHRAGGGGHAE